jgi:hypothetical protein
VVMQKAVGGGPGDTFLTKLITRNLKGKETRYLWTRRLEYVLCSCTLSGYRTSKREILTLSGFRQVTLCRLEVVYFFFLPEMFVFIARL